MYRQFGLASEAAQLLETELGTILLEIKASQNNLFLSPDPEIAKKILDAINRKTLGQSITDLDANIGSEYDVRDLFSKALEERNRLTHHFFREHNIRILSAEGCAIMLQDLKGIHEVIFRAYKVALKLSGIDLNKECETLKNLKPQDAQANTKKRYPTHLKI